jgi:hypothetical protein
VERLKVVLLAVIAGALCVQVGGGLVPVAHAEGGDIVCNAWHKENVVAAMGEKGKGKAVEAAMEHANSVRAWMLEHPGDPVFRTTVVQNAGAAFVDILCVR